MFHLLSRNVFSMYQSFHMTAGYSHFKINIYGQIELSKKNQGVVDALVMEDHLVGLWKLKT